MCPRSLGWRTGASRHPQGLGTISALLLPPQEAGRGKGWGSEPLLPFPVWLFKKSGQVEGGGGACLDFEAPSVPNSPRLPHWLSII